MIVDVAKFQGSQAIRFGDYEQTTAEKDPKRERFLIEMEEVMTWKVLFELFEP